MTPQPPPGQLARSNNPLIQSGRFRTPLQIASETTSRLPVDRITVSVLRDITDAMGTADDPVPDLVSGALRGASTRAEMERIAKRRMIEDAAGELALEPERVMVAYRLTREMAVCMGLVSPDQTLLEALKQTGFTGADGNVRYMDMWAIPQQGDQRKISRYCEDASWRPDTAIENVLASARMLADHHCPSDQVFDIHSQQWITEVYRGLPLMPPPPLKDPGDDGDPLLDLWLEAAAAVADRLGLEDGTPAMPSLGLRGMRDLLSPEKVRDLYPSRLKIAVFETLLVEETLRKLSDAGQAKTRRYLRDKYGLLAHESNSLLKCAKYKARQQVIGDLDEDRALMILRLEGLIDRARESCDLRNELGGLKALAVVLGLAKVEADNGLSDFVQTVRKVNSTSTPTIVQG